MKWHSEAPQQTPFQYWSALISFNSTSSRLRSHCPTQAQKLLEPVRVLVQLVGPAPASGGGDEAGMTVTREKDPSEPERFFSCWNSWHGFHGMWRRVRCDSLDSLRSQLRAACFSGLSSVAQGLCHTLAVWQILHMYFARCWWIDLYFFCFLYFFYFSHPPMRNERLKSRFVL